MAVGKISIDDASRGPSAIAELLVGFISVLSNDVVRHSSAICIKFETHKDDESHV